MKVALYRHFDGAGVLLYVGISNRPIRRLDQHGERSSWADCIARVEIEWHQSRDDALAAETEAIRKEGPVWNVRKRGPKVNGNCIRFAVQHFNSMRYDGWYLHREDAAEMLEFWKEEYPRELFGLTDSEHTPIFFISEANVLKQSNASQWAHPRSLQR